MNMKQNEQQNVIFIVEIETVIWTDLTDNDLILDNWSAKIQNKWQSGTDWTIIYTVSTMDDSFCILFFFFWLQIEIKLINVADDTRHRINAERVLKVAFANEMNW